MPPGVGVGVGLPSGRAAIGKRGADRWMAASIARRRLPGRADQVARVGIPQVAIRPGEAVVRQPPYDAFNHQRGGPDLAVRAPEHAARRVCDHRAHLWKCGAQE